MIVPVALLSVATFAQTQVSGYVFEDKNNNGVMDRNEKGLPNVAVSNNVQVAVTDSKGRYTLPVQNDNIIFV